LRGRGQNATAAGPSSSLSTRLANSNTLKIIAGLFKTLCDTDVECDVRCANAPSHTKVNGLWDVRFVASQSVSKPIDDESTTL
jgi:hypothetical protein